MNGKSGALAELSKGINNLLENMSSVVLQGRGAAEEVRRGADESREGRANVAARTEAEVRRRCARFGSGTRGKG